MAKKPLHCIFVGKVKHRFTQEGCALYAERIRYFKDLSIREVRDGDGEGNMRLEKEARNILEAFPRKAALCLLDERGRAMSSRDLSKLISDLDTSAKIPCFLVGGAYGVSETIREKAQIILSLSNLTLPHDLARLFLLEQIYRAHTILHNIPYHH